jgi:hypothetical protein
VINNFFKVKNTMKIVNTSTSSPISSVLTRLNVSLLVIISTAPERRERRDAIRKTYWRYCSDTYSHTQVSEDTTNKLEYLVL